MAQTNKKPLIWILSAVVVIVIIAGIAFAVLGGNDNDTEQQDTPTESQPAPSRAPDASSTTGGDQGFSTPTQDYLGRQVLVPNNHYGQPMGQLRDTTDDVCSADEKSTPAEVKIQQTVPMTLWSTEDGPSGIEDGVPTGYSKSPRGAALAMWNYWTLMNRTDDVSWQIVDNHLELTDEEQRAFDDENRDPQPVDSEDAPMKQIAPAAYRVTSCDDDYIVFDIARSVDISSSGERLSEPDYVALRMAAVWDDGDWKLQLGSLANSPLNIDDIEGWTRWSF